jgi:hypothetical protein
LIFRPACLKAEQRYSPSASGPPRGKGVDALNDYFTLQNARQEYNLDQAHRASDTSSAFRELAESFGGIAGKKTVIWLTGDASPLNPSMGYEGVQPTDMNPYSSMVGIGGGEAANARLAMDSVAGETGAAVLAGNNRIEVLFDRAYKLWANYYVLAFVPQMPPNENEASYHRIQVKVDRPGVHVPARRGFLSRPEAMLSSASEIQRDLAEAATSPIDLTSL